MFSGNVVCQNTQRQYNMTYQMVDDNDNSDCLFDNDKNQIIKSMGDTRQKTKIAIL